MVLLRPRLCCHYCGGRGGVIKPNLEEKQRRFKCEHCQAVNYLDENGGIADVPPEEAADPENILGDTDSPAGSQFESSIFCQTCVKNQLYFNKTLSDYLPDPEDPQYANYEAALPEYRKKLEDRYPQVCARCEPRVRQQLQQATYTAKSDHVRRMLVKSRERRIASRLGWRSLVVTLGGLGYWTSVAGQLIWHAMGALTSDRIPMNDLQPRLCLHDMVMHQATSRECTEYFGLLASHASKLGILCFWWNPRWQHKLAGREGRLTNLDTYYQVQAGIAVLRLVVWAALQNTAYFAWLPADLPKAIHGISLVLLSVLAVWSNFVIITIDTTPMVDWTQEIGPLLSEGQYVPPQAPSKQFISPINSQPREGQSQQFSIGSLAPASTQQYTAWRPPTPPTEDLDAMDWEPPSSQFTAQPRKPVVTQIQPSPFYGTLPALNLRGVHPARSAEKPVQREAIGIPPGFFDSGRMGASQFQQAPSLSGLAEPTFFPQQDTDAIGLEKIFDDVFKLRDDTALPRPPQSVASNQLDSIPAMFRTSPSATLSLQTILTTRRWSASNILAAFAIPFVSMSLLLWMLEDFDLRLDPDVKVYMSLFTTAICLGHLLLKVTSVQRSSEHAVFGRNLGPGCGTVLSMAELAVFATLSLYRWRNGCPNRGSSGQVDPLIYFGLLWQELCYFMVGPNLTVDGPQRIQHGQLAAGLGAGEQFHSPNPSEASTTIQHTGFGRPRGNSLDSEASTTAMSVTSATSTATGWKTPKLNPRRAPSTVGPSPGFSLGGLHLDDWGSGAGVAGSRSRAARGRGVRRGR